MQPQQHSSQLMVEVAGRPLPADIEPLLIFAFVDDSLHVPDMFVLRFRDPDRIVLTKTSITIGTELRLSISTAESPTPEPLLLGEVTAVEAEQDGGGTFTVVRGFDHSHRLFRGRVTETYAQVTASDVVKKVAQRAGLQLGTVEPTKTIHPHVSQANVNDWQFLQGLARENGYETVVVDGKLCFRPPAKAADGPKGGAGATSEDPLVLALGTDLLRFRAVITAAEQVGEVSARGWDVQQKKALVGRAPAATTSAVVALTPAQLAKRFGSPVHVAADVPFGTQAEVDTAAAAAAEQIAGAFAQFEGLARGNPKLRAGTAIAVDNLGDPFDGNYTLTSTRHVVDPVDGYTTWFTVSGRQERSLLGLTSGGGAGAGTTAPSPPVSGVVTAVVTNVQDPERRCRVKLNYPWLSDTYESDWVRTAQLGAGKSRGGTVLPEVNDEVLVAFERGDLRHPYVLAGLYNGVDLPPDAEPALVDGTSGAVNRRGFISRDGHSLQFLDQDGQADGITLTTGGGGLQLSLDKTKTAILVTSDGTVTIKAKNGVTVDAGSSKIELSGGQIALKAKTGVDIDGGSGTVKVHSGTAIKVEGTQVSLNGSAQTEVKAGMTCSISAGIVRIN